jgi:hypothetical protein
LTNFLSWFGKDKTNSKTTDNKAPDSGGDVLFLTSLISWLGETWFGKKK